MGLCDCFARLVQLIEGGDETLHRASRSVRRSPERIQING